MGPIQSGINQAMSIAGLMATQTQKFKDYQATRQLYAKNKNIQSGEESLKGQFKRFFNEEGDFKGTDAITNEINESKNLSKDEKQALTNMIPNVQQAYTDLENAKGNIKHTLVNEYGDKKTIEELSDSTKKQAVKIATMNAQDSLAEKQLEKRKKTINFLKGE